MQPKRKFSRSPYTLKLLAASRIVELKICFLGRVPSELFEYVYRRAIPRIPYLPEIANKLECTPYSKMGECEMCGRFEVMQKWTPKEGTTLYFLYDRFLCRFCKAVTRIKFTLLQKLNREIRHTITKIKPVEIRS